MARIDLLQGTLDVLILRTLVLAPMHGHGIAKHIQRTSDDVLLVEHGSLYPALQRLERKGWISSGWQDNERGGPMEFYRPKAAGQTQISIEESGWKQPAV